MRATSSGQSLVEFALVLPVLILILMGILDAGRLVYAYNAVSNAAREAGRTAIVDQGAQAVRDRAAQQATALGVPTTDPGSCPASGGPTTAMIGTCFVLLGPAANGACPSPPVVGCVSVVSVKWTYQPIIPILGNILGSIPVVAISRQPIENVCPPAPSAGSCPIR
jgi:Flp pilus assembly protein TadG